ncbi:MAG: DUF421 domain-containing protein [Ruminococcaceae bacterium]|nr:DUF421 domain-containing protein [Oscillospiraceae bacterium]
MVISFIRTIILYIFVVLALRLMGKRQIGELQPSELVVAIMISDLATVPVADIAIPLLSGIMPIITLVILEVIISFINLKSEKFRNIFTGKPTYLIKNGVLQEEEMRKLRYNIEDLLSELRLKDVTDISTVYTAILETNGELSIVLKSENSPVKLKDINIKTPQEKIPLILISDGIVRNNHLEETSKDIRWLKKELKKRGITNLKDVFILSYSDDGQIFLQTKERKK